MKVIDVTGLGEVNENDWDAVVHMLISGSEPVAEKFKLPSEPISIEPNPWYSVLCVIVQ